MIVQRILISVKCFSTLFVWNTACELVMYSRNVQCLVGVVACSILELLAKLLFTLKQEQLNGLV